MSDQKPKDRFRFAAFVALFVGSLAASWPPFLQAQLIDKESVGTLQVEELILRPALTAVEAGQGEFTLENSTVGFLWEMEDSIRARLKIGDLGLLNRPQIFADQSSQDNSIGFFEAYGEFQGLYGRFRFGLIPVGFGWSGSLGEADLVLPRPQFLARRWVSLRDFGGSFEINHNGYFTRAAVHNGEGSDQTQDNQTWLTSAFGWQDGERLILGFSGQVGQSEKESTSTVTSTDFVDFDKSRWAKWRTASVYSVIRNKGFSTVVELVVGEYAQRPSGSQKEETHRYYSGYWDVKADLTRSAAAVFRLDMTDPSREQFEDQVREVSLGAAFVNEVKTSTWLLLFTKRDEDPDDLPDDRFSISWKVRPYF